MEPAKPTSELLSDFGIQCSKRFIKQKQFRFHGQRSGQGHALSLPPESWLGITVGHRLQLNECEQFIDLLLYRVGRRPLPRGSTLSPNATLSVTVICRNSA